MSAAIEEKRSATPPGGGINGMQAFIRMGEPHKQRRTRERFIDRGISDRVAVVLIRPT
jgi:hypothetical protein